MTTAPATVIETKPAPIGPRSYHGHFNGLDANGIGSNGILLKVHQGDS